MKSSSLPLFVFGLASLVGTGFTQLTIPTTACSSAPYSDYLYLSSCPEASWFCTIFYSLSCSTYVTTTSTSTITTSTAAATITQTATITTNTQLSPTTTTTVISTVIQTQTNTITELTTEITALPKRSAAPEIEPKRPYFPAFEKRQTTEQRPSGPASCSNGILKIYSTTEYGSAVCPCLQASPTCEVLTTTIPTTTTTTLPFTATQTITATIINTITSGIATTSTSTTQTTTTTVTSTSTQINEIHPCNNVATWPTYRQDGFCNGYFILSGTYFNTDLKTCCLNCFNRFLCSSFSLDANGECNLMQNQHNVFGEDPDPSNPVCPWGLASNAVDCADNPDGQYTVRLGPCGVP